MGILLASFALLATGAFLHGQTTQPLPPAPPVAGPGPNPIGIAGPGAGLGIAGPGIATAPIGIAGPGAPAPLPGSSGIATTPIDSLLSPNMIGIAGPAELTLGIATEPSAFRGLTAPTTVVLPSASGGTTLGTASVHLLGPVDATRARISRRLSDTVVQRATIAAVSLTPRFEGRVAIQGERNRIVLVRSGN